MFSFITQRQLGNSAELIKKCEKFDFVSLDIFDTTIIRLTSTPEEIFALMEFQKKELLIANFKEKRMKAQKEAERKYGPSTTLENIYEELSNMYGVSPEVAKTFQDWELEQETETCIVNRAIIDLIGHCKSEGKTVVFTSDMYIPALMLEKLLKSKGVHGYDDLIVSCDYGKTKARGELFEEVYKKYRNKCRQFIHIGDTLRSDFVNPLRSKHFSAVLVAKALDNSVQKVLMYSKSQQDCLQEWGYQYLGPVMYGFCNWIKTVAKENNISQLIFLTREGAFIKDLYDICDTTKELNCSVFYISRRSLFAAMADLDWDSVCEYLTDVKSTVQGIQEIFHIAPDKISEIVETFKISRDSIVCELPNKGKIFDMIRAECVPHSIRQRNLLVRYIKQLKLSGNVGVVDIGWHGTMQYNLQKIINNADLSINIIGIYLGEYNRKERGYGERKYGYLCSKEKDIYTYHVINATYVFETSLQMRMGTVLEYSESGENVVPVIDDEIKLDEKICQIQKGIYEALRYLIDYQKYLIYNPENTIEKLFHFLDYPSYKYACAIGDIKWVDLEVEKYIAKPDSFFKYILKPGRLHKDITASGWNSAFLRRVFKIPLPYFNFYNAVKKHTL